MRSQIQLIIILCLVSSIGRFVVDSYLPALPLIAEGLNLSSYQAELTMTLYLLGFGLSQPIYGPLSDHFGRRKILLLGLCVFLLGSYGCIIANSGISLLFSRLLTGIGAGACGTLNRAIACDRFEGVEFAKAWSYTTTALVLTLIMAPVIGALVQKISSWRAIFFTSFVFVAAILVIIYFFLPETAQQRPNLTKRNVFKQYRDIFTKKSFLVPTVIYSLTYAGLMAYFQISSLLFINEFGMTALNYAYASTGIALSYLLGGMLVRRYVDRLGVNFLLHFGILLLIIGGGVMLISTLLPSNNWQGFLVSAIVYTLGARLIIPNANALAMKEFRHVAGSTSALIGCFQMLGSTLISALLALFSTKNAVPLSVVMLIMGISSLIISCRSYKVFWLRQRIQLKYFLIFMKGSKFRLKLNS